MKFAVLFSGQGAQKAGMGLDLLADSLFAETIDEASSASGQNIVADFKSENDELKKQFTFSLPWYPLKPAFIACSCVIFLN